MAEEDEIDVLGDFSLDNILSKNDSAIFDNSALVSQNSDFFNCDYTIHPQWLLDKPSANPACWYNNTNGPGGLELSDFDQTQASGPPIVVENSINDESGWTEKEKTLLTRGIDIFGKSYTRLSQFVGSKTPAEVKYFLCNFYSDVQLTYPSISDDVLFERNCIQESINAERNVNESETIEDSEIPALVEEVIAAVSTAEPTVKLGLKKNVPKKVGQSLTSESKLALPLLQHYKVNHNLKHFQNKKFPPKVKFKTAIKLTNSFVKKKRIRRNSIKEVEIQNNHFGQKNQFELSKPQIHIFTGENVSVPVYNGEEVIKIPKENLSESGSDVEIDIEDDELPGTNIPVISNSTTHGRQSETEAINNNNDYNSTNVKINTSVTHNEIVKEHIKTYKLDYTGFSSSLVTMLQSEKYPEKEYLLPENDVTELERFVFNDFFEGRGTNTPNRYLKIRNHIIDAWCYIKPSYVTKTSTRQGLKNCGDVKNIGKVHSFLEQIGAINFGTVQVNYARPLSDWIASMYVKEKPREKNISVIALNNINNIDVEILPVRSRQKKFVNDGKGGCTLTHNESGNIIKTTVINEDPVHKPRAYIKKPIVRLIYCRTFHDTRKQEHRIRMSLAALLLMDLHAHMSLTEVMGLVGGHLAGSNHVRITRYVPCKNVAPSLTHCDMCPISQANATDTIHLEGLRVLGWYHSHPTFAPEPSQTDIDTQLSVQQWLGGRNANDWERSGNESQTPPCLGIILSPFSSQGALIASPYRCMIVKRASRIKGKEKSTTNVEGSEYVPYKFNVDLNTDDFEVDTFLSQAWNLLKSDHNIPSQKRIKFEDVYFQDENLTYMDKFITSVKMHLAKCSNLNKRTCDLLVDGLSDICLNRV